tara:strand:+ start:4155 stop:5063 length:909 start_codon:yes stop_codon:yes gene_type:complete
MQNIELIDLYPKCPCCGSFRNKVRVLNKQSEPEEVSDIWCNTGFGRYFFDYSECADCGLLFVKRYPKPSFLPYLYNLLGDNIYSKNENAHQKTMNGYERIVRRYLGSLEGMRILELGPDIGTLCKQIHKYHDVNEYFLIEPNKKMHERLASISKKNKNISNVENEKHKLDDGSVDLIIMIHVLDHLVDPKGSLAKLLKKLKPGGCLFSVTHNHKSPLRYLMRENWPPFCMHHPQLFSKTSKEFMFKQMGVNQVVAGNTTNYFPVGFYLSGVLGLLKINVELNWGPDLPISVGNIFYLGKKVS